MAALLRLSTIVSVASWLSVSSAADPVSITSYIGDSEHGCIRKCLYFPGVYEDVGTALACATPYDNNCYCATASASASVAKQFIESCASKSCNKGDFSQDITSLRSYYASYCMANGFTQPGLAGWVPAAATSSPTQDTGTPETSTQLTIVTATTQSKAAGSKSRVVVQQTSTVWVGPNGSAVSNPDNNGGKDIGKQLGIGLGVGIPVAAILAGLGAWFCFRRRRQAAGAQLPYNNVRGQPQVGELHGNQSASAPFGYPAVGKIDRKPVASVSPAPITASSGTPIQGAAELPQTSPLGHEHELPGYSRPQEMTGSPQPVQRWELHAE